MIHGQANCLLRLIGLYNKQNCLKGICYDG